jgi:hypothetical protein
LSIDNDGFFVRRFIGPSISGASTQNDNERGVDCEYEGETDRYDGVIPRQVSVSFTVGNQYGRPFQRATLSICNGYYEMASCDWKACLLASINSIQICSTGSTVNDMRAGV